MDPHVAREMELAHLVKETRARGASLGEVQAIIEAHDLSLEVA